MSQRAVRSYRLALPPPWHRISLRHDPIARIQELVDDVAERYTPKEIPPDQVGPKKRELVEAMRRRVVQAQDNGGVDLYLPLADIRGYSVQASFVVSEVTPNAMMTPDEVPGVLTSLLRDAGTSPVTVADTVWVRRERRFDEPGDDHVPHTRIEYVTALPGAPRYWIMATFSSAGDPIVGEDGGGDLLVELFDAIMTTWRWEYEPGSDASGARNALADTAEEQEENVDG